MEVQINKTFTKYSNYKLKKILYISYDSIIDPISESQILPVLKSLSKSYKIYLISFEKTNLKSKEINFLTEWHKIKYKKTIFGKTYSFISCLLKTYIILKKKNIKVVHCRSYIPATIVWILKKIIKIKYIFDIRGFWFDEKKDAKLLNNFTYKILKNFEKNLFNEAEYILTLSKKSIPYITKHLKSKKDKVQFITCFTDTNKFKKSANSINKKLIFGYVGNVGLSYNFKKVLNFLKIFDRINSNWKLLFVNNYISLENKKKLFEKTNFREKIIYLETKFSAIEKIYKKINIGIYFLKKDFSKIASCPTKLGEMLSSGIPVITNSGIGDIETYLNNEKKSGFIVDNLNEKNIQKINNFIFKKKNYRNLKINARLNAKKYFEKNKNITIYKNIYKKLT